MDYTDPLRNGVRLPDHPATTTALKVTRYGEVYDAKDHHPLTAGLHANEIRTLMGGGNPALAHLYRYAIRDGRIYHTRSRVVIAVDTEEVTT